MLDAGKITARLAGGFAEEFADHSLIEIKSSRRLGMISSERVSASENPAKSLFYHQRVEHWERWQTDRGWNNSVKFSGQ
jgi:hypothetical protein